MDSRVQVKKFFIDYRENGSVGQFHSDLAIEEDEKLAASKIISVNDPLRFGGVTMYQTDWGISAVQLRVDGSEPYNLAMAPLQTGDNKLFGTFLPLGEQGSADGKGISILARDLQTVVFYDQQGNFVGVRRPGSRKAIEVDKVSIVVEDLIGSTGLELKSDPGVPVVYAGFGGLMLTTIISYLSHSQVWALQDGTWLLVGGKSNRAKLDFERELNDLLDLVQEVKCDSPSLSSPCKQ
jgi:cytochrome c biogenesis protein